MHLASASTFVDLAHTRVDLGWRFQVVTSGRLTTYDSLLSSWHQRCVRFSIMTSDLPLQCMYVVHGVHCTPCAQSASSASPHPWWTSNMRAKSSSGFFSCLPRPSVYLHLGSVSTGPPNMVHRKAVKTALCAGANPLAWSLRHESLAMVYTRRPTATYGSRQHGIKWGEILRHTIIKRDELRCTQVAEAQCSTPSQCSLGRKSLAMVCTGRPTATWGGLRQMKAHVMGCTSEQLSMPPSGPPCAFTPAETQLDFSPFTATFVVLLYPPVEPPQAHLHYVEALLLSGSQVRPDSGVGSHGGCVCTNRTRIRM